MPFDLALDLNGDLMFGSNRDLLGASGDALTAQRIKVRLKVPRGEWVLDSDGTLGSRLELVLRRDPNKAAAEIPIFVDEALNTMDDVEITGVKIDDTPFDILIPGPTINLLNNPSWETGASSFGVSYLGVNNGFVALTPITSRFGKYSVKSVARDVNGSYIYSDAAISGATAGRSYSGSLYVKGVGSTIGKAVSVFLSEAGGSQPESTGGTHVDGAGILTADWQRIPCSRIITENDRPVVRLYLSQQVGAASGDVIYTDAWQLEQGSSPTDYCDGSLPHCGWVGAPNASMSYRMVKSKSSGLGVIVGFRTVPVPGEDEPITIQDDPDRSEQVVAVSF